ncbi:MAG: hypothetical protein R3B67_08440 [Phycisphaerales bacterium]
MASTALCGFFPIDKKTIQYFRFTGKTEEVALEAWAKASGFFWTPDAEPKFASVLEARPCKHRAVTRRTQASAGSSGSGHEAAVPPRTWWTPSASRPRVRRSIWVACG